MGIRTQNLLTCCLLPQYCFFTLLTLTQTGGQQPLCDHWLALVYPLLSQKAPASKSRQAIFTKYYLFDPIRIGFTAWKHSTWKRCDCTIQSPLGTVHSFLSSIKIRTDASSTSSSKAVTYQSTVLAINCFTSVFNWEPIILVGSGGSSCGQSLVNKSERPWLDYLGDWNSKKMGHA